MTKLKLVPTEPTEAMLKAWGQAAVVKSSMQECYRAMLEAAPNPWQPIETAPRDGTHVLFYTIHGTYEVGWWDELDLGKYEPVDDGLYRRVSNIFANWSNDNRATHWMPLPEPPEQEEG